ncbi:WYL domain-containing protein [Saccharopolyspora rosea]|uniref:Helix-turn-helix transcriptional regulator n=1 Tax=Saccharopolyspora rosea TaxID=524884 RepID=A0ABW3FX02_9PSEU
MRASRLIALLCLLQARGSMTGAELARELEVSERTVARDVLALAEAGVPVYAERGRTGGYRLLGGYRQRLTGLHRAEAEALLLAGVPGPAGDMGLADAVAAARVKLSASLAPPLRDAPERVGRRFHLDAPRWFRAAETPDLLPELSRAVWQDRAVTAWYRRDGAEVRRELEPHGLVLKAGVWYLAARRGRRFLVYRVDRFSRVEPGAQFARDESFDLAAFWDSHVADFGRSLLTDHIRVRLSPTGLRRLPVLVDEEAARGADASAGEADESGWVTATMPVESLDVAYEQMLRLGPEVEVLDPPELRRRMADAASRLTALYR